MGEGDGWAWFFDGLHAAADRRRRPFDRDTLDRLHRARMVLDSRYSEDVQLEAKGVEFLQAPEERPYGVEAMLKDDSGNWFSMTQHRS